MLCIDGFAQKGIHAVGISVEQVGIGHNAWRYEADYWKEDLSHGCHGTLVGFKYQYGLSDRFIIEPQVSYLVQYNLNEYDEYDKKISQTFNVGVNLHTNIVQIGRFYPYAVTGVQFLNRKIEYIYDDTYRSFDNGFAARLGLGCDIQTNLPLRIQIEGGYNTRSDFFVALGATYIINNK